MEAIPHCFKRKEPNQMTSTSIKRTYIRRYRDNGQVIAYVDWADGSRTEANHEMFARKRAPYIFTFGTHMHALFARAKREGLKLQRETW